MLLFSIFLHQKLKKNKKRMKERSFGNPCGVLTFLFTLSFRTTCNGAFRDYLVVVIFGYFQFLVEKILRSINSASQILGKTSQIFAIQMHKFASLDAQQSNTAKLPAFFQQFQKRVCALKANQHQVELKIYRILQNFDIIDKKNLKIFLKR